MENLPANPEKPDLDKLLSALAAGASPELREWVLKEYVSAKVQGIHILNYAGGNLAYNHACDVANKLGLTQAQSSRIAPFPGLPASINIMIQPEKPPVASVASPWKSLALPLLASLLTAGSFGLGAALMKPPGPAPTTQIQGKDGKVNLEVEGFK